MSFLLMMILCWLITFITFLNGIINAIFYCIGCKNIKNNIKKYILAQKKNNRIDYIFNYSVINPKGFIFISLLNIFLFILFLKIWSLW